MNIIVDTNILIAVAFDEPEKQHIIDLTIDATLIAPEILLYEAGNALSAMVKRHQISSDEAIQAFDIIQTIPIRLVRVDILTSLGLALDHNIYAYDAYFLQSARKLSCPLLSLDKRMNQVAESLGIKLLE